MKHLGFVVVRTCAVLSILSGCGSIDPGSDSDSDSNSGTTTEPVPLTCAYGNEVYEDGEEFATPDGCLSFRCEDGGLNVLEDNLVTIAGDLDLPSQEDVNAQTCLSVVNGALTISGTAADLTPLAQLSRVGGTLDITASDAVTLTGLENLGEIGADIIIADNAALTTLSFQVYMSVFGNVTIQNNDVLTSLSGAEFIGQCGTCSAPEPEAPRAGIGNDSAGDGGGDPAPADGGADAGLDEPGGGTFFGQILIADNDALTDVFALSNLYFAWDDVRFRNNAALTSLAGMQLTEVQGDLEVSDHGAMDSADAQAFAGAIDVWGTTTVCGNAGGTACP